MTPHLFISVQGFSLFFAKFLPFLMIFKVPKLTDDESFILSHNNGSIKKAGEFGLLHLGNVPMHKMYSV